MKVLSLRRRLSTTFSIHNKKENNMNKYSILNLTLGKINLHMDWAKYVKRLLASFENEQITKIEKFEKESFIFALDTFHKLFHSQ